MKLLVIREACPYGRQKKIRRFDITFKDRNVLRRCFGVASEHDVKKTEKIIGVTFPEAYKKLIMSCDGGFPQKDCFLYYSILLETPTSSCLGMFFLFSKDYPFDRLLVAPRKIEELILLTHNKKQCLYYNRRILYKKHGLFKINIIYLRT